MRHIGCRVPSARGKPLLRASLRFKPLILPSDAGFQDFHASLSFHTCGALREADIGQEVRLSGWCHRIRDHGGLLFIDLRDHYGMTQCVVDPDFQGRSVWPRSCAPSGW